MDDTLAFHYRPANRVRNQRVRRMKNPVFVLMAMITVLTGATTANQPSTAWQSQKCQAFEAAWGRALDVHGTDNMNYDFVAQNENFIESDCIEQSAICPRSDQEIDVANDITFEMMGIGLASTFLPYRCQAEQPQEQTPSAVASDAELCRSQLDLLVRGGKLTEAEQGVFAAQCECLETQESAAGTCAQ